MDHSASEQNLLEVIGYEAIGQDRGKNGYAFSRSLDHRLAKRRINKDTGAINDVYHFIKDIYNKCKKNKIKPLDFIGFIKDLFDFYPTLEYEFPYGINKNSNLSLSSESEDDSDIMINSKTAPNGVKYDMIPQNHEIKGNMSSKKTNEIDDVYIEIPFISQVSSLLIKSN